MSLLRVLIPSWKFFDRPGSISNLFYQIGTRDQSWGPWQSPSAQQTQSRSVRRLFLNASENAWLARRALVDRLCEEFFESQMSELNNLKDGLSYRLVENWIRWEIVKLPADVSGSNHFFRFKIEITEANSNISHPILNSATHEI